MIIKKFARLSNKVQVTYKSLFFLLILISLLMSGISGSYVQAQTDSSGNQNVEDTVKDKKMKRLQSKILRLEKRVLKKPDDIIAREELIKLRKRYFKMFDPCIEKVETQFKDKIDNNQYYEIKIKLLKEKKESAFNIKEDYSQLSDGQIKYLEDLRRRALRGSTGFEGNIRYMKVYEIERVIYELVRGDSVYNMQKIIKEIEREKERCIKTNKDFIEQYVDEIIKLETLLQRVEDDYKEFTK